MIRLFESTATEFTTNGLGCLSDAVSCEVVEERNGAFELEMEYPVDGIHYEDLALRRIIVAKPNPYDDPQAFRIYSISSPINCIVTVNAAHISYDLSGIPASPFTASSLLEACSKLKAFTQEEGFQEFDFLIGVDKPDVTATMNVQEPISVRALLGGTEGSLLDTYRGEYSFNNFTVTLHNNRGTNNGTVISYGKNLTNLKQDENCNRVYTGVYPYWRGNVDDAEVLITLPEKYVSAEGTFDFKRVLPLNLSSDYEEAPTQEQLRNRATSYISENKIGVPKVSLDVEFIPLSQTDEYEKYVTLERIRLCDEVTVRFPKMNIDTTAKCVKTEYDAISDRYISIELGEPSSNLAKTISNQASVFEEVITEALSAVPSKTFMEKAIDNATSLITGGLGGYVVIRSSSGDKTPDEILILDTPDPLDAEGISPTSQTVWRWNKNGFGVSTDYGRTYALAMTKENGGTFNSNIINVKNINADNIVAGTINGDRIDGGTITGAKLYVETSNQDDGIIKVTNPSLSGWYTEVTNNRFTAYGRNSSSQKMYTSLQGSGFNIFVNTSGNVWEQKVHIEDGGSIFNGSVSIVGNGTPYHRTNFIPSYECPAVLQSSPDYSPYKFNLLNIDAGLWSEGRINRFKGHTWFGDNFGEHGTEFIVSVGGKIYCYGIDYGSDRKIKKNIKELSEEKYIKIFDNIHPSEYQLINGNDNDRTHFGYIAQDVQKACEDAGLDLPSYSLISEGQKDRTDESEEPETILSLNYTELMVLYDLKIRQQEKRINELEDTVARLEKLIEEKLA